MTDVSLHAKIVYHIIRTLLNGMCLFIVIYKSCVSKKERSIKKKMIIMAIFVFAGQFIGNLLSFIRHMIYSRDVTTISATVMYIVDAMGIICSEIGKYVFLAVQLKLVFDDTIFKIKKSIINLHKAVLVMALIFIILTIIFYILSSLLGFICLAIAIALIAFGMLHISYLFNRKLFLLLISQRREANNNLSKSDIHRESNIMKVIIKTALLNTLTICFAVIMIIYGAIYFGMTLINRHTVFAIIYDGLWTLLMIMASLNIFFMLSMNQKMYRRLCKICNLQFKRLCSWCTDLNEYTDNAKRMVSSSTSQHGKYSKPTELRINVEHVDTVSHNNSTFRSIGSHIAMESNTPIESSQVNSIELTPSVSKPFRSIAGMRIDYDDVQHDKTNVGTPSFLTPNNYSDK